jgi:2-methylisocitrate lyase-like PEP mutase family enzyme
MSSSADEASALLELHAARALLKVVNVCDAASAKVVADLDGTTALATASHSIAASHGYEDGEKIPVDLMIEAVGRIAAATSNSRSVPTSRAVTAIPARPRARRSGWGT